MDSDTREPVAAAHPPRPAVDPTRKDSSDTLPVSADSSIARERRFQRSQYAGGRFLTTASGCRFFAPGDTTGVPFACGGIIVGLTRGTSAADVTDLLTAISGEIVTDLSRTAGFVSIRVPRNSERVAILRAYDDARVRYAEVNAIGPVVLGAPP